MSDELENEFIIVRFIADNTADFIPNQWLCGRTKAYWPVHNVADKRKERCKPQRNDPDWPLYDIQIYTYAGDVEEARKLARDVEMDISGEASGATVHKGKKKSTSLKRKLSMLEENDTKPTLSAKRSSTAVENAQTPLPDLSVASSSEAVHHDEVASAKLSPTCTQDAEIPQSPSDFPVASSSSPEDHHDHIDDTTFLDEICRDEQAFRCRVLEMLYDIHLRLTQLEERQAATHQVPVPWEKPLSDEEDLMRFCDSLSDPTVASSFQTYLRSLGGVTVEERIRRILRTTIAKPLAEKISWKGTGGTKLAFKDTPFNKCMHDALRDLKDFDSKRSETTCKNWFKLAKYRKD